MWIASLHRRVDLDFEVMTESHAHEGLQDTMDLTGSHARCRLIVCETARRRPLPGASFISLSPSVVVYTLVIKLYVYIHIRLNGIMVIPARPHCVHGKHLMKN